MSQQTTTRRDDSPDVLNIGAGEDYRDGCHNVDYNPLYFPDEIADLRRCWANHLLVEQSVSPRIVMALGGWSSYDAIEPYLAAPTEGNIVEQMSRATL